MFTKIDKALAPVVVAVIFALLGTVGISESMSIGEAVPLLVAAVATYFVPNKG